jgi:hypothetical protein
VTDLPSGTATFLFTDIEASAEHWELIRPPFASGVSRVSCELVPGSRVLRLGVLRVDPESAPVSPLFPVLQWRDAVQRDCAPTHRASNWSGPALPCSSRQRTILSYNGSDRLIADTKLPGTPPQTNGLRTRGDFGPLLVRDAWTFCHCGVATNPRSLFQAPDTGTESAARPPRLSRVSDPRRFRHRVHDVKFSPALRPRLGLKRLA